MVNDLLLLSGNDIPFTAAGVTIHPPTIKEIGYIGEETFFTGCELINFSKDILDDKDKTRLEHLTNFEVLMSIMNDTNVALRKQKTCALLVLTLLFPTYQISLNRDNIELAIVDEKDFLKEKYYLTKERKFDDNGVPIFSYSEKFNTDTGEIEKIPNYQEMYDLYFQKVDITDNDFVLAYNDIRNKEKYEEVTEGDPFWWEDEDINKSVIVKNKKQKENRRYRQ